AGSQSRPTSDDNACVKQPRRLRRLTTIHQRRPVFFMTICTAQRQHLLANPEVHSLFAAFSKASPEKANISVGKYVLMPDHIHVFVAADGSAALSRWVGSLKKYLASHWRTQGMTGPFWQEGFFDHVMRSEESMSEKWLYVHENPVRAELVQDAAEWQFAGQICEVCVEND
ncbi:MAG: transposase, partial [Verrucomicrobiia bacterium]